MGLSDERMRLLAIVLWDNLTDCQVYLNMHSSQQDIVCQGHLKNAALDTFLVPFSADWLCRPQGQALVLANER